MVAKSSMAIVGAGVLMAGLVGSELPAQAGIPMASYATAGAKTSVPYGWIDFCNRYAPECDGPAMQAADVELSPKAWADLGRVNQQVNGAVEAITDMDHWGVIDRWDYPTDGKGDCEDYALFKRKLLIEAGFPRQALLMTVVRDHQGEGHAVLTVKTSRGDFVLDNLTDKIKPWTETGYKFVKRQSQEDPNTWVDIGVPTPDPLFTAR
jgi:predicted transglutaminase-like cysteine proteinase